MSEYKTNSIKGRVRYEAEVAAGEAICAKCQQMKPLQDYPKGRTNRCGNPRYKYCKPCHRAYAQHNNLKRNYGLSTEEYEKMIQFQGGVCAVCQRPPKPGRRLAVDHCHKTGLIRGGLCWLCNRLLGVFRDDPAKLRAAIAYLEHPPASTFFGKERLTAPGRIHTVKRRKVLSKFLDIAGLKRAKKQLDKQPKQ